MLAKFFTLVTHQEKLPTIDSQSPLITWNCNVTWKIKYFAQEKQAPIKVRW